jgi:hypothetical protein
VTITKLARFIASQHNLNHPIAVFVPEARWAELARELGDTDEPSPMYRVELPTGVTVYIRYSGEVVSVADAGVGCSVTE